jgi:hypothetical protein
VISGELLKLLTPVEGLIGAGQTARPKCCRSSRRIRLSIAAQGHPRQRPPDHRASQQQPAVAQGTNLAVTQPSAGNLAITVQQAIASSVAALTRIDTAQLPVGTLLQGKVLTSQALPQVPGQPTVFRSLVSLLNTA